jgi:predicted DNA-binding protein (UPF0251 family)
MRPKKTRWVKCEPKERCFRPRCKPLSKTESIFLILDELEAVRLADLEGLKQEAAAKKMKISRSTFSRIISCAHKKIGDALINIKAIRVKGGCCKVLKKKKNERKK